MLLYGKIPEPTPPVEPPSKPTEPEVIIGYKIGNITLSVMEMEIIENIRRLSLEDIREIGNFIIEKTRKNF